MILARPYLLETKFEFVKLVRLPAYVIPTLAFPLMFYVFFGLMFGTGHVANTSVSTYLLATYGAFGVIGATLFGFGVSVAVERGQGWMLVKRASPMPPAAYFLAKVIASAVFSAIIVALLFTLGALAGGVRLAAYEWLGMGTALVLGALPFCSIGLAIGYIAGPNSAPAIVNLINLPMSFLSGLWIPIANLPPAVQHVAPFLPAYHLGQLALDAIGAGDGSAPWTHVLALTAFTSIALSLAAIGFRRDEGKLYG